MRRPRDPFENNRDPFGRWAIVILAVIVALMILAIGQIGRAEAHEWYDARCCNDKDCRPLTRHDVKRVGNARDGYAWQIKTPWMPKPVTIPHNGFRVAPPTASGFHACFVPTLDSKGGLVSEEIRIVEGKPCVYRPHGQH